MPPCSPQGLLVSPSAFNTRLGVAVHVLAAPIAGALLDALLASLARVAVPLHAVLLAAAMLVPVALLSDVLFDVLLV